MTFGLPPDAPERCEDLLDYIANLLRPVAERAIMRKIADERQMNFFFEDQVESFALEIRHYLLSHGTARDVAEHAMREVRRRLLNEVIPKPEDDPILEDEVVRTLFAMALAWFTLLQFAAVGEPPNATLDAREIGEDMLPTTLSSGDLEALDEALSHTVVTPDEFRRFLRFVRGASGCQGPLIPEMTEFLTYNGITVEHA